MSKILNPNDPLGKTFQIGPHRFPGVWQYMLPVELQGFRYPEERRSTCMNCPKSCYEGYRPDYRCCTYHPRIPNFLLGLAYDEGTAATAIEGMIRGGMATPEGMNGTPQQWIDYLSDVEDEHFGKSHRVLCPMLDQSNGLCRVHAFRNTVCSTFFCLKDHGDVGDDFWAKIQSLGSQVEAALAQWALKEIGFDFAEYIDRMNRLAPQIGKLADDKNQGFRPEVLKEIWGRWYGKEIELFLETARLISDHRHNLWDIANHQEIVEAEKYDRAMINMVPKKLQGQVEAGDLQESGETVTPKELWQRCFKTYQRLWQIPFGTYKISSRVKIYSNAGETEEQKYYHNFPYYIAFYTDRTLKEVDWRRFMTTEEKQLLKRFEPSAPLDWKLLKSVESEADGRGFFAEMIAARVLVKVH